MVAPVGLGDRKLMQQEDLCQYESQLEFGGVLQGLFERSAKDRGGVLAMPVRY